MTRLYLAFFLFCTLFSNLAYTQQAKHSISGTVVDSLTQEPIIGVTVMIEGTTIAVLSNMDGTFVLTGALPDSFKIRTSSITYQAYLSPTFSLQSYPPQGLLIALAEEVNMMNEVVVVTNKRASTELGVISQLKESTTISSGVSAAQIAKSGDRDASEVIKRTPGVSIIDNRFVIVRGLSQRYNNVWINGGAVPSSESDGRAFSFDVVPSSQIENIIISKSPAPENPGDEVGGFIKITTKSMPESNSFQLGATVGYNTITNTHEFRMNPGGATDWLGFDAGKRPLSHQQSGASTPQDGYNTDWGIKSFRPLPDLRLSLALNKRFETKSGVEIGMISALGYSNTYKTLLRMRNARYGAYSAGVERPEIVEDYEDNQYSHDNKINALYNLSFRLNSRNRIDVRNLFSLFGKNRLTEREGTSANSGVYYVKQTELLYNSRLTYAGQVAGNHRLSESAMSVLDWNVGYSYANKQEPDRRIIKNLAGYSNDQDVSQIRTWNDRIERHYLSLYDHVFSGTLDYKRDFSIGQLNPQLKVGAFGTYRNRELTPRQFIYRYDNLSAAEREEYLYLPYEEMMAPQYLGASKVYIDEISQKYNAYSATDLQYAAYAALNLPLGKLNAYVGVRYEGGLMTLTYDKSMSSSTNLITTRDYPVSFLLPSVNLTYGFNSKHILRGSYGKTINRPEFREVSPAVYYDFDLMGEVQGNVNLLIAEVHNYDLRYEYYPSNGELVSVGVFYKHFLNPIEWNFVDMGGSLRYSFGNAKSATTIGVELDMRKSLDFIGVPNLTWMLNATLVDSKVEFNGTDNNKERDRAMQGQSPYLINTGMYYQNRSGSLGASVLYNRIGKRIIGIGKSNSVNGTTDSDIPDSYEMPRNTVDVMVRARLSKGMELKVGINDLLAEDIVYKQFPMRRVGELTNEIEQVTKQCKVGASFLMTLTLTF